MRWSKPTQWIAEAEERQMLVNAAHDASEGPAKRAPAWRRDAIRRWVFDRAAVRAMVRGEAEQSLDSPGASRPAAEFADND
jgi:hypothetical protein